MIIRANSLKRLLSSFLGVALLIQSALFDCGLWSRCSGGELIRVEQAGDQFVNFVLDEIETAKKQLPAITQAAEAAAERIVDKNGELLSAGDHSFSLEPVWRAGGIAFSRQ